MQVNECPNDVELSAKLDSFLICKILSNLHLSLLRSISRKFAIDNAENQLRQVRQLILASNHARKSKKKFGEVADYTLLLNALFLGKFPWVLCKPFDLTNWSPIRGRSNRELGECRYFIEFILSKKRTSTHIPIGDRLDQERITSWCKIFNLEYWVAFGSEYRWRTRCPWGDHTWPKCHTCQFCYLSQWTYNFRRRIMMYRVPVLNLWIRKPK